MAGGDSRPPITGTGGPFYQARLMCLTMLSGPWLLQARAREFASWEGFSQCIYTLRYGESKTSLLLQNKLVNTAFEVLKF